MLRETGDFVGSHAALAEALAAYREGGDRRGEGLTLRAIALTHRATGELGLAADLASRSIDVLAGRNPFAVHDEASLQRYLDTVFFDDAAKPTIPWPADRVYIARRTQDAAFEQAVLDRIGRSDEPRKKATFT